VLYVESLIGPRTITTVPPETLRQFEHHGVVERTLPDDVSNAQLIMIALEADGINFADVNRTLEEEGIERFAQSLNKSVGAIGEKRTALGRRRATMRARSERR
jgi:transaldolase